MARFYGTVQGHKGEASRMGSAQSGMDASVNGWDTGVNVRAFTRDEDTDVVMVTPSGGSNGVQNPNCSMSVTLDAVQFYSRGIQVTLYRDGTYQLHRDPEAGTEV